MIKLKIGGVPEHFNLPWHLALEAGRFEGDGVEVAWHDYPGGSGAMAKALREEELDAALLLTEGAVAAISNGVDLEIASLYTDSPLVWGIHVPAASRWRAVNELEGARYAISRLGSGSHLMAVVHARTQGWTVDDSKLVVVRDLAGAVASFAAGESDVFFWEKFMTKPLVDSGQFRRVGEFAAPWPAFVVCLPRRLEGERRAALARVLERVLVEAHALQSRKDAPELIAARYGLQTADVREWLATTRWSTRVAVAPEDIAPVCAALGALGVLPRTVDPAACIAQGLARGAG